MRRNLLLLVVVLIFAGTAVHSDGSKEKTLEPQLAPAGPVFDGSVSKNAPLALSPATILQIWTFDDSGTQQGDPQGWTSLDRTVQPAYFHAEDFAGMSPPFAPISGTKSLWLGRTACNSPTDCVLESDGYGNDWEQFFVSMPFVVSGNVAISFDLRYDCEASYDSLSLYYVASDNVWHRMGAWSGVGAETVNAVVPSSAHTGTLSFGFVFKSDAAYSDEDGLYNSAGAAVIDNLQVGADPLNPIDLQEFDNAADGATYTPDYHWFAAGSLQDFGNYAGLCDADTVLQEDPGYTNSTHVWTFFNGSTDNYACGGHPEQLAVPYMRTIDGRDYALHNEVQSPPFSIAGFPAGHAMVLSFDVYRDLPQTNMVMFGYRIRSKVGGVWKPWGKESTMYYDPAKEWKAASFNIQSKVRPGATDIQVALVVRDMCPVFCGLFGAGCHSQGPMFDNVRIIDGNTTTGSGQVVQPVDETTGTTPVTVTFSSVTAAGNTSLSTGPTGPPAPGAFVVAGSYYDISTTATTSGPITVCISYDENTIGIPEGQLRMLHWDTALNPDQWVDITGYVDAANNVICGYAPHLSPFVIGYGSLTGVGDGSPRGFALHQNVPNPFNPSTTITYDVPEGGATISLRIYDAAGRLVRTLIDGAMPAGTRSVQWDGRASNGQTVSSGVYFYKMTSGSFVESRRMLLLK